MTYLTPELLAQPSNYHVEEQHTQPLFEAISTPLKRISSGNFRQMNGEFVVTQRSMGEVGKSDLITEVPQSMSIAPFAEVRISTDGLLRILRDNLRPELTRDIVAYTSPTSEHGMRWTDKHWHFPVTSVTPPEIYEASVQIEVSSSADKSHAVITETSTQPPKWIIGRRHLPENRGQDEIAEHMSRELGHEFGTDNLTFGEYRAALWIAEVIDKNFPPIADPRQ